MNNQYDNNYISNLEETKDGVWENELLEQNNDWSEEDDISSDLFKNNNSGLLKKEEERELIRRAQNGDEDAFNTLVKKNSGLVATVAKKYTNNGIPLDDLIQEGRLGLVKAINYFDLNIDGKLSTYAIWWIKQKIERSILNNGETIRIPVHMNDEIKKYKTAVKNLQQKYQRIPTVEEIAEELQLPIKKVKEYQRYSLSTISLNTKIGESGTTELLDFMSTNNGEDIVYNIFKEELKEELIKIIDKFASSERNKEILMTRWGFNDKPFQTLEKISIEYNITAERVRQIEMEFLKKVRKSPKTIKKLQQYLSFINVSLSNYHENTETEISVKTLSQLLECNKEELNIAKQVLTEEELALLSVYFGKSLKRLQNDTKISPQEKERIYDIILPKMRHKISEIKTNTDISGLKQETQTKQVTKKTIETQSKKEEKKGKSDMKTNDIQTKKIDMVQEENNLDEKTETNSNDNFIMMPLQKSVLDPIIFALSPKEQIMAMLMLGYIDNKEYKVENISGFLGENIEEVNAIKQKVVTKYQEKMLEELDFIINHEPSEVKYKTVKMKTNK